jgi:hypothetical protein
MNKAVGLMKHGSKEHCTVVAGRNATARGWMDGWQDGRMAGWLNDWISGSGGEGDRRSLTNGQIVR